MIWPRVIRRNSAVMSLRATCRCRHQALLSERPHAIGWLSRMPVGSPGMEVSGAPDEPMKSCFFALRQRSYGRFLGSGRCDPFDLRQHRKSIFGHT